jgi:hypothetical protein
MRGKDIPLTPAVQRALFRALGNLHQQSKANLEVTNLLIDYVTRLDSRTAGIQSVAEVVDENYNEFTSDKQIAASKELISHLYRESHSYVILVIGGGYAAYFATISITAERLNTEDLIISSLLMMISLSIFVMWEVFSVSYLGYLTISNKLGTAGQTPRWFRIAWPVALFLSLITAAPAIFLAGQSYVAELIKLHDSKEFSTSNPPQLPRQKLSKPPQASSDETITKDRELTPPPSPPPPSQRAAGGP